MRILLVDDAPIILDALDTILSRPGVEIDRSATCREAIDLLDKNTYDWVTLDLNLPDGRGTDILSVIRDKYPDTHTVIISLEVGGTSYRKELLSLGADEVFSKSFNRQELIECIFGTRD